MVAIDSALDTEGLRPFQRPIHVGRKFWEAFRWEGQVLPPKLLADRPGFDGDILMAKAHRWYEETYGDRLKSDWAFGYAPVRIGNAIWRVRAPVTYGQVRLFIDRSLKSQGTHLGSRSTEASLNVLCEVDGLPQGLVDRLTDRALQEHLEFHVFMHENLQWREELPQTELLTLARADYDESTAAVLGYRFAQARWASQQAVEKTLKGLLSIAGTRYPTGGPNGHDLQHIGGLLKQHHGIDVSTALLSLATCSPKVRYGEERSSEEQALHANHAVLGVLEQLRRSPETHQLLSLASPPRYGA